jgi:hypothetical protein
VDIRDPRTLDAVFERHGATIDTVWNLAAPLSVETAANPAVAEEVREWEVVAVVVVVVVVVVCVCVCVCVRVELAVVAEWRQVVVMVAEEMMSQWCEWVSK